VKNFYTFLALLLIVVASHARQPSSDDADGKRVDKSKSQRVASPNRTSSREWATLHKPHDSDKHDVDKDHRDKDHRDRDHSDRGHREKASSNRAAIVWVDSKGSLVGRALTGAFGRGKVLVTFKDEPTLLGRLEPDSNCDLNLACTYSGGARWGRFEAALYTSADCTGTPYIDSFSLFGTPKFGIPIFDGGETFIYIADVTQSTAQTLRSFFSDGACSAFEGFASNVSRVNAVVPVSTFGIQPYFIK
jgi:hypothetical protein